MTFKRTGGFAGISIAKVFDTAALPAEEANQLRQLVDAADFFHLPATITSNPAQPDRFGYQLTVDENGRQHAVEVSEQGVPDTLMPLIEWLMAAVRRA
jgi:hypothetical protein